MTEAGVAAAGSIFGSRSMLRLLIQRLTNLKSNLSFSPALPIIKQQCVRLVLSSQFLWFLPVKNTNRVTMGAD